VNDTRFVSPFTQVDATPTDIKQELTAALDRLATLPGIQRVRRTARAALDIRGGQRLLDAGCGAGEEARELARLAGPDGEVTAIDLSSELVPAARQRDEGSGVRYAVGDITALDFPDATFDGVRTELRGRLVRARLTAVTAEPVAIPISDRSTAETLYPFLNPALLGRVAAIPRELADQWFSAFEDALARNEFLAVLTIWMVTGVKPAASLGPA
jgi:SAM-dependent methyltransferase